METYRDRTMTKKFPLAAGVLVAGLGFSVAAAADTVRELPAVYTTISSIELDPQKAATELASSLVAMSVRASETPKPQLLRYRKLKVLSYSRAVPVGKENVIVRLQSPGKRKSIMSLEFKF